MRFLNVMLLALWQLTAIPFVAVLSANALKPSEATLVANNITVVYKSQMNGRLPYIYMCSN